MLDNLKKYHIILASNSPRRRELLAGLGIDFEVHVLPDIEESYPPTLPACQIAQYIAKEKARAYSKVMTDDQLIITADTVVIADNEVMGKPTDAADAYRMLRKLSGRKHQVVTGVCLTSTTAQRAFSVTTDVAFKQLTDDEIHYYIDRYHPFDKAGAYGIQEWIGYIGIPRIEGSFYTVMGFPTHLVYSLLNRL